MSNADELLKLKKLLDDKIITNEEFEKKKSILLNADIVKQSINDSVSSNAINNNTKKGKSTFKTVIIVLFIIGLIGIFVAGVSESENNGNSKMILDVNQFYNSKGTNTLTENQLIKLKGKPKDTEKWKYKVSEKKSYSIKTLSYDNGEEYSFYKDHLAWIKIERKIKFTSKNNILSMFGLKVTKDTKKFADTNYALRYNDCGVASFWVQGIEDNTFNWVKIIFSETFI